MQRTTYEVTPPVPFPPPDPADLAVTFNEAIAQDNGRGWIAFRANDTEVKSFFLERSALKYATKEPTDG
jgi:hypothetical protein